MKVLILANSDVGLYKFRRELIKELLSPSSYLDNNPFQNSEVIIACPKGDYIQELEDDGCTFIETYLERRSKNPIKDLYLVKTYWKIVRNIKPDIVLTYTIKPNIYGGILCQMLNVPYISNITGLGSALENTGVFSRFLISIYRFGTRKADTVFFQNQNNLKSFYKKKIRWNAVLIPGSGVNLEKHVYLSYPDEREPIRFLYAGRIMRDKGVYEYFKAAEILKKKYPDLEFTVVGAVEDSSMEPLLKELNTQGIISYLGYQDNIPSILAHHHVLVLPSYHEGLSNVLLEAAASGRPVIASNIPGCKETFESGITGLSVEPHSYASLVSAMESFIQLGLDEKKAMGLAGREKVSREFDRKIVIQKYLDAIYKKEVN